MRWAIVLLLVSAGTVCGDVFASERAPATIPINAAAGGRAFEGVGALSAGASSRLLLDYPDPARSDVLDLLFKPKFGASLQHLKVEIGGDINSTDGTEPSFARTRAEFDQPRREYFERGYEWWLMVEARRRSPGILLDALQWGAPAWIGDHDVPPDPGLTTRPWGPERWKSNSRKFYTQDNADFIAAFLRGAQQYHGLDINFCGVWNETAPDLPWIKRLRATLDAAGLRQVRIIAADQCGPRPWEIAKDVLTDRELAECIYAIGAHYVSRLGKDEHGDNRYQSIPEAKQTGKPLWASEDGPTRGDWRGAGELARMINRNYIRGRVTKTIIWSLVTSYYDNLPAPNSGLMKAMTPWSGHYEIQPALWAIAHTTQFVQPGWRYLDSACGITDENVSYVTLVHPKTSAYSMIIESIEAGTPRRLDFQLADGMPRTPLAIWRTTEKEQFERVGQIDPADGRFAFTVEPHSIYTLTTTVGQAKGKPVQPPAAPFPLPYREDFEAASTGRSAKYFSDQAGVYEVAALAGSPNSPRDGGRQVLLQTVMRRGIDWHFHPNPEPYTVLGSMSWRNIEVSVDARLDGPGYVALYTRIRHCPQSDQPPLGYAFCLESDGRWTIKAGTQTLREGSLHGFSLSGEWHRIGLRAAGRRIAATIDGGQVGEIEDFTFTGGMVGLGNGWHQAWFDNFSVVPIEDPQWANLAAGKLATASSSLAGGLLNYGAAEAFDGYYGTRWNAAQEKEPGEWLQVDLGRPTRITAMTVHQFRGHIRRYTLEGSLDGTSYYDLLAGETKGEDSWTVDFAPASVRYVRLRIDQTAGGAAAIYEMELYDRQTLRTKVRATHER